MPSLKSLICHIALVNAINLYVSSYDGNLTTLALNMSPLVDENSAVTQYEYELTKITTFNTNTQSPSWLTLDKQNNVLYMIDEAVTSGNGTIVSYHTDYTGILTPIQRQKALAGGVYATFFASGSALAIPHYSTSALQTYLVTSDGHLTPLETFTYNLAQPGPVSNRQGSSHPHEAILDPTEQYILVPDLGADLVHIYSIDQSTRKLTALTPLKAKAGSGPRHGAFSFDTISGKYVFYLGAEIAGTVTAYRVKYLPNLGGLVFTQVKDGVYPVLGPNRQLPATTTGQSSGVTAEVTFSPDGKFLVVSDRMDSSFRVNKTLVSDSMATFSLQPKPYNGGLDFLQLFPAGGTFPRQFSFNTAGNLVAVGLQMNGTVAILERNPVTGKFTRQVALAAVGGNITCVVWDD